MSEDRDALQGIWKLEFIRSQGRPVSSSVTHWEFSGDQMQEIVPHYVGGGTWAAFTLETTTTPRHLDTTYTNIDADTGEITSRTYKHAYELDGDTLRVSGALVHGRYPEKVDEAISSVTTLSRYDGPRPETKQASGREPVEDAVLGTLTWDDDFEQWKATFVLGPDHAVSVTIDGGVEEPDPAIAAGASLVTWAKEHEPDARAYAAAELINLAEDWRDEDEDPDPITPESFADRISLESLSLSGNGSATFWYEDDDIFAGHVIVVSLTADRKFTDAQIMG